MNKNSVVFCTLIFHDSKLEVLKELPTKLLQYDELSDEELQIYGKLTVKGEASNFNNFIDIHESSKWTIVYEILYNNLVKDCKLVAEFISEISDLGNVVSNSRRHEYLVDFFDVDLDSLCPRYSNNILSFWAFKPSLLQLDQPLQYFEFDLQNPTVQILGKMESEKLKALSKKAEL